MALIPPIGTSGIYKLADPFQGLMQPNMSYRCDAVRRLSDLLNVGVEPYEEYYQKNGLSKDKYDQDTQNQVSIVSLVSTSGHWIFVPTTYILQYPDLNGVAYHVLVLGLELGAIATYKDLTGLKTSLANLCRDTVGVLPTVKEAVVSAESKLSQADADALEAGRQVLINNTQTDRAKYLTLQQENAALRQQITDLENYIKSHLS